MSRLLIFLFLYANLFAESSLVESFENDPSAIVENVNVLTGEAVIYGEDLVIQGTEPIRIPRSYFGETGRRECAWEVGESFAFAEEIRDGQWAIREKNGSLISYSKTGEEKRGGDTFEKFKP